MTGKISAFSARKDLDDIIEIRLWDNQYRPYYKRKARISDEEKIAEIFHEIKKAYGVDIVQAAKKRKESNWFD